MGFTPAGDGATVFGNDGRFVVIGNASPYAADADAALEPDAVRSTQFIDGVGVVQDRYGDTRLGVLSETLTLNGLAARLPLAPGLADSVFQNDALVQNQITRGFDGGYAAGGVATTRGVSVENLGLLYSDAPDSVFVGFSPTRNGVAARIGGLIDPFSEVGPSVERLNFGGGGQGAFLTDDLFAAQASRAVASALDGAPNAIDGTGSAIGAQTVFRGAMASAGLVGDGGLPPADAPRPQAVRWGWWTGDLDVFDSAVPGSAPNRVERFALGSFVVGDLTDLAAITPQSIVAYDGVAIGHVLELPSNGPSAQYVAGGRFSMTYDFLDGVGDVTLSILGQSFTAAVFADSSGLDDAYSGQFMAGRRVVGDIGGAFFAARGDPVRGAGGSFALEPITGAQFVAGVFAADADPMSTVPRTVTPLPGLVGVNYGSTDLTSFTDVDGETVVAAAQSNIVVTERSDRLDVFDIRRVRTPGAPVEARAAVGASDDVAIAETSDIAGAVGFFTDGASDVALFADPEQFYLQAEAANGGGVLDLTFFGRPTPDAVWATAYGPDEVELRVYDVSDELFTGRQAPLPPPGSDPFETATQFVEGGTFNHKFVMVPRPGAANAPRPIVDLGDVVTRTQALYARLDVVGEGPAQASYLGLMASVLAPSLVDGDAMRRQPLLSDQMTVSARPDPLAASLTGRLNYAFLDTLSVQAGDEGAQSFGDNGQYLVLGNNRHQIFSPQQPAAPRVSVATDAANDLRDVYGDTRLAILSDIALLSTAGRLPLAALFDPAAGAGPNAGTDLLDDALTFSIGTSQPFASGLSGGFAAANAVSIGDGTILERYLVASKGSDGARVGMNLVNPAVANDSQNTGLAVAFRDLVQTADTAIGRQLEFDLNFGNSFDADVLITDAMFAAEQTAEETGELTGQPLRVEDLARNGPSPLNGQNRLEDRGFTGRLVSRRLVGDGGPDVFPENFDLTRANDIDTTPEYLRWGWWSGEIAYGDQDPDLGGGREQLHLGSFVAGVRADIGDVRAQIGGAAYEGFAVAHVLESDGAQYVDGGRFTMNWNFGGPADDQGGVLVIDDILQQAVSARVALSGDDLDRLQYQGVIVAGPDPDLDVTNLGDVRGAFFRGPASLPAPDVAATAGSFDYATTAPSGNSASVSGVYGADRAALALP
jgi:hypothetical protein